MLVRYYSVNGVLRLHTYHLLYSFNVHSRTRFTFNYTCMHIIIIIIVVIIMIFITTATTIIIIINIIIHVSILFLLIPMYIIDKYQHCIFCHAVYSQQMSERVTDANCTLVLSKAHLTNKTLLQLKIKKNLRLEMILKLADLLYFHFFKNDRLFKKHFEKLHL